MMKTPRWTSLVVLVVVTICIAERVLGLNVELAKDSVIVQIVKTGEPVYDAKEITHPIFPALGFNNEGQVAFLDILSGAASERSSSRIAVGSAKGLTEIVRTGQPSPDSNGSFSARSAYFPVVSGRFAGPGFQSFDNKCLVSFLQGRSPNDTMMAFPNPFNVKGQVAFLDTLTETSGGEDDNIGIFVGGAGSIRQIARAGQSIPDNSGVFSGFSLPVLNDNGDVAFEATIWTRAEDSTVRSCTTGIFLATKSKLTQIVRTSRAPTLTGRS
jgi:hypothetical protein